MSGKIKIGGLAFAAALFLLFAGLSFGQANQDPCGGHYAGQALQAKFLRQYIENDISYDSNICNDLEDLWYQYFVPGGDCIFLFRRGHIVVSIDKSESTRNVAMHFDKNEDLPCNDFDFMNDATFFPVERVIDGVPTFMPFEWVVNFDMTLRYRLALASDNPDDPGVLVLTGGGYDVNFGEMTPGQTMYCADAITFEVDPKKADPRDPNETVKYQQNSQVKVTYRELTPSEGGGLGWEVTPIHVPFYYLTYKKVWIDKRHYTLEPEYTYHNTSLYRDISTSTGACGDIFYFPFKLIIKRVA